MNQRSALSFISAKNAGFTLIEIMVTVAIVAILAAIALPSYRNYIVKSHVKGAGADLVALALIMENQHQVNLSYPATSSDVTTSSSFPGFSPAEKIMFTYSVQTPAPSGSPAPAYLLTATGKAGQMTSGCTLKLDSTNARQISAGSGTSVCGGLTTW